jgi:hypothetical protein
LVLATVAWLAFWVIGLPDYYQQYSAAFMAWFDAVLTIVLIPVLFRVLRGVERGRRLTTTWWIAFYFTVPLALYDWLYCGVYLGHGGAFLSRYWYISVYYIIPWIVVPGIAVAVNRHSEPG